MAEKTQYNIRIEDQLKERLALCAQKSGFVSGNEFAAEALNLYAETLVDLINELRKIEKGTIKRQREQLLAKLTQGQESGTSRRK